MIDTCQSVKGSCNMFIEPQFNQFPRFLQLATRFENVYRVSFDTMISDIRKIPDRSLDTNARNSTVVKMIGSTIL